MAPASSGARGDHPIEIPLRTEQRGRHHRRFGLRCTGRESREARQHHDHKRPSHALHLWEPRVDGSYAGDVSRSAFSGPAENQDREPGVPSFASAHARPLDEGLQYLRVGLNAVCNWTGSSFASRGLQYAEVRELRFSGASPQERKPSFVLVRCAMGCSEVQESRGITSRGPIRYTGRY
jgi:hypothetical protein